MADTKTSVVIQARVDGLASVKNLEGGLTSLGNKADTVGGKFQKFNGLLRGLGGAIAAAGIGRILGNASEVAAGFETETRLLEQGLRNVGAGTGELERLQGVADKLGKATLFNEEDFRQGFGLLTSFGNIGTENYEKVATAAANVAQVSGTDVSSAFMQLAKALNDPVAGLSALSRSGIQFTDQQKEMIKGMVESGDVIGAQTMILKELEAQYGGTAVAAAGGAAGVKDTFGEAMYDLNVAIGSVVNTALPPLLNLLTNVVNAFTALPGPVQTVIVAIAGIGAAALLLAPLVTAFGTIGPLIAGIGPLLAGLLPAIGGVISAIGGFLPVLAAVFSGPVGWIALLVASGVAIYTFRDQISGALQAVGQFFVDAFATIGGILQQGAKAYMDFYVTPVLGFAKNAYDGIVKVFSQLGQALSSPFQAAANMIRGVVNSILNGMQNAVNSVIRAINTVVQGANRALAALRLPQIPLLPQVTIPKFAEGGMVKGPTLGLVGEAGPEYIVPAHKATRFAENILAGVRGPAAIPRFAEGGYVSPSANVSIQTGPVTQMNGTNYVTTQDLNRAVQSGVNQTLSMIAGDGRVRRQLGLA